VNSYLGLQISSYIQALERRLEQLGFRGLMLIMAGNGGVMAPVRAARQPAKLILSGPAAGPIAGLAALASLGRSLDGIVVDMGGTSFDVSVIRFGRVQTITRRD